MTTPVTAKGVTTRVIPNSVGAAADAAVCLAQGGLVAFPTETVYGLGADATNATAVAKLYAAKGRPSFNPLIAHVFDLPAARRLAVFDAAAERLAARFWPGPLTLVLKKRAGCPVADLATAGLDSIAVRVPDHELARDIIKRLGHPVVAPSANQSGHVSPTTAKHVLDDLEGRVDLIIDGGPAAVGVESTIVALLDQPLLLRPGGLPRNDIRQVLGKDLDDVPVSGIDPEALIAPVDAQIAGLPDSSPAVRLVKARSDASLRRRRGRVRSAVESVVGPLEIVNGGGTGSLEVTGADPSLTELAAGSGLIGPTLFDGYDAFTPHPAVAFALPVVRRPAADVVTCFSGGYIASGPAGDSRVPSVHHPEGLRLIGTEGAGEVQTPLRGKAARDLAIGDRVWWRHAKAGELAERFDEYVVISGDEVVDVVPTYRGEGRTFG